MCHKTITHRRTKSTYKPDKYIINNGYWIRGVSSPVRHKPSSYSHRSLVSFGKSAWSLTVFLYPLLVGVQAGVHGNLIIRRDQLGGRALYRGGHVGHGFDPQCGVLDRGGGGPLLDGGRQLHAQGSEHRVRAAEYKKTFLCRRRDYAEGALIAPGSLAIELEHRDEPSWGMPSQAFGLRLAH